MRSIFQSLYSSACDKVHRKCKGRVTFLKKKKPRLKARKLFPVYQKGLFSRKKNQPKKCLWDSQKPFTWCSPLSPPEWKRNCEESFFCCYTLYWLMISKFRPRLKVPEYALYLLCLHRLPTISLGYVTSPKLNEIKVMDCDWTFNPNLNLLVLGHVSWKQGR